MSLIVNGTTITKVKVIKDGVTTTLSELKVGNTVVFKVNNTSNLPVTSLWPTSDNFNTDKVASYGDLDISGYTRMLNQYSNDGTIAQMADQYGHYSCCLLSSYHPANGNLAEYQSFNRAYVGPAFGVNIPDFLKSAALDVLPLRVFTDCYFPIEYNNIPLDESTIDFSALGYDAVPIIPILNTSLHFFGYTNDLIPHEQEFHNNIHTISDSTIWDNNQSGADLVLVFMENEKMAAIRHAEIEVRQFNQENVWTNFDSTHTKILFQPYGDDAGFGDDVYMEACRYYFGDSIASNLEAYGDSSTFYDISGYQSGSNWAEYTTIIIMDGLISYGDTLSALGYQFEFGNPFYDIVNYAQNSNNVFFGPWVNPWSLWPGTSGANFIELFADELPRNSISSTEFNLNGIRLWPGAKAIVEMAAVLNLYDDTALQNVCSDIYQRYEKNKVGGDIYNFSNNVQLTNDWIQTELGYNYMFSSEYYSYGMKK